MPLSGHGSITEAKTDNAYKEQRVSSSPVDSARRQPLVLRHISSSACRARAIQDSSIARAERPIVEEQSVEGGYATTLEPCREMCGSSVSRCKRR